MNRSELPRYFSEIHGLNDYPKGLPLDVVLYRFEKIYKAFLNAGYFSQSFGNDLNPDAETKQGEVIDSETEFFMALRKETLWPIDVEKKIKHYEEHDLFDVIQFLYNYASKPLTGGNESKDATAKADKFAVVQGKAYFRDQVNKLLRYYVNPCSIDENGDIFLSKHKRVCLSFRYFVRDVDCCFGPLPLYSFLLLFLLIVVALIAYLVQQLKIVGMFAFNS